MATGKVKFFNDTKGFGFITPDEGGKDVFVHRSGLKDDRSPLPDNSNVKYDVEEGRKGKQAINVELCG